MFPRGIGQNQGCQQCLSNLPIGFKIFFFTSIIFFLIGLLFPSFAIALMNIPTQTIGSLNIWRLITSVFVTMPSFFAILNVLICFYMLYQVMPALESQFSTVFILVEILTQTFLSNLIISILGFILVVSGIIGITSAIGFGSMGLILIFMWRGYAANPDGHSTFCCMPCLIPNLVMPWLFLLLLTLFGSPFLTNLTCCLLGYLQYYILRRNIIRFPLSFYYKLESFLPNSLTSHPKYISVRMAESTLIGECGGCCNGSNERPNNFSNNNSSNNNSNPFSGTASRAATINSSSPSNPPPPSSSQAPVQSYSGGGVAVGGKVKDYRSHWANKDQKGKQLIEQQEETQKQPNKQARLNILEDSNVNFNTNDNLVKDNHI